MAQRYKVVERKNLGKDKTEVPVVISFHFSIFETLKTTIQIIRR